MKAEIQQPIVPNVENPLEKPVRPERVWRVGTLSMGLFLVILGSLTLSSKFMGPVVFDQVLQWWPIVFVLLGLEILMYTAWKGTRAHIRYDFVSMFVTAILSIGCIGFAMLSSMGLTTEIRRVVTTVEQTVPIQEWHEGLPEGVSKVIVQGANPYRVKTDVTTSPELHVFGNYRTTDRDTGTTKRNLYQVKQVGNTMYVLLGQAPSSIWERDTDRLDVTVAAPKGVTVIVRDSGGQAVTPAS